MRNVFLSVLFLIIRPYLLSIPLVFKRCSIDFKKGAFCIQKRRTGTYIPNASATAPKERWDYPIFEGPGAQYHRLPADLSV